ncbi:MAG: helix-turn-helix transcriptional regulator [Candidatus Acidiferrum sp.]|jgi:transcriptional regulator with XRE-family HTH domain
MNFNSDLGWIKKQAALEDNCFVSVGGLVCAVEDLEHKSQRATASRTAFVNLLNLSRREHKLTWEQFSQKLDVDLAELIEIENDEHYQPTPRTVNKIAIFLRIPAEKLFILSGLARAHDKQFQEAALRFAARSQPVEALSSEEHEALKEYVKFLCER